MAMARDQTVTVTPAVRAEAFVDEDVAVSTSAELQVLVTGAHYLYCLLFFGGAARLGRRGETEVVSEVVLS